MLSTDRDINARLENSGSGASRANDDRLRGYQVFAAEYNVERALPGSAVAAILTAVIFYRDYGFPILVWAAVVVVFCTARVALARQTTKAAPQALSAAEGRRYIYWAAVGAVILTGVPTWVSMQTEGFAFTFMLAIALGTFWAGAFVHGPVLASSLAFMGSQLAVSFIAASIGAFSWERFALAGLFTFGAGAAVNIVRQHSAVFRRSLLQQIELGQKADVIGLLLNEHEHQSSDWLWQADATGRVIDPSTRFRQVLSEAGSDLPLTSLHQVLVRDAVDGNSEALGRLQREFAGQQSFRDLVVPASINGQPRWFSLSGRAVFSTDDIFTGYRGVMGDVTAAKLAEARVVHLAHHDALTDLPNRAQFTAGLDRALTAGQAFALLSLDLDGFKAVNDRHGHPTGDALLVEVARRLRAAIPAGDLVARFGGDEFMLQVWEADLDRVADLCQKLISIVSVPFLFGDLEIAVGASIGVALAPADGKSSLDLLKSSDSALYRAKNGGRGTFCFFSPDLHQQLQSRQALMQDLRAALSRNELVLFYQPFVDAHTGRTSGHEALLRWRHPDKGLISPVDFIPLAEESGLIVPIGAWIIEEACREALSWPDGQRVAVNISPVQFRDGNLPQHVQHALARTGLNPSRLEVEVTETVLVDDPAAALDNLERIRALGVRVALDDFGTGYSSLSYLRRFPFDKIKIDKSFVDDLETRLDSQVIVRAIRDIAVGLDMTITAEGVETAGQAEQLRRLGCTDLQGFLFSRPKPAADLLERTSEAA